MKHALTILSRGAALFALTTLLAGCLELSMIEPWLGGPSPSARTTRQVVRPARPAPPPARIGAPTREEQVAWRLLERGCADQAADLFAREIACAPGLARPYVGHALGTALRGDLCGGSSAMRAALRLDPEVLDEVDVSPKLARVIDTLIDEYHYDLRVGAPVAETALTLSALHYLRGDLARADTTLALCRRAGGRTTITEGFGAIIDDRLAPPPPPEEPVIRLSRPSITPPPAPVPVPVPVPAPAPEPEPMLAADPAPTPAPPTEPVDYDKLRTGIQDASDSLDRFTDKLLKQIASADTNGTARR